MAITLKRVCANVERLYGMKLIAGAAGLEKFVRWVHMIEDREVPRFLHGNELVFTTGIAQNGSGWLLEFIMKLQSTNASGLVVNVGPYVPEVPASVVEYCEKIGFPLYTVPWSVHLIDITYELCHRIVANEEIEVGLATAFKNLIYMPDEVKSYKTTLERRGFHYESDYCVIAMQPLFKNSNDDRESRLNSLRFMVNHTLNKNTKPFCIFYQEEILTVILNDFDAKSINDFIRSVQHEQQGHSQYTLHIGVSPTGRGYPFVSAAYHKAVSALRLARLHSDPCLYYQDMGVYKLLISVEDKEVLHEYYRETLGKLEGSDKKSGTDYMDTLRCYLENDASVQAVAQKTYVHRNTINYKLKQIRKLLKSDLTQEDKLKYMLAFYISDIL